MKQTKPTKQLKQVVIIGGDGRYLNSINALLESRGYVVAKHVDGRNKHSQHRSTASIPARTKLVVMLTEYVTHNVKTIFATEAKRLGIEVAYCRSSVNDLRGKLECLEAGNLQTGKQAMTCV